MIKNSFDGTDGALVLSKALDTKNWKRLSKYKIGSVNSYYEEADTVYVYPVSILVDLKGQAYTSPVRIPASNFLYERKFILCPEEFEDMIQWLVLEKKDGPEEEKLVLSEFVGD